MQAEYDPDRLRALINELMLSNEILLGVIEQLCGTWNPKLERWEFKGFEKPTILNALYYLSTKGLINLDQILE